MSPSELDRLRSYTDKRVRIVANDGEHLMVKLILMQDEYQDFICDIIETDRRQKYKHPLDSSAYTISYGDIASFELAEDRC
jgi:hypothetical protein